MDKAIILDIQRMSTEDGPGLRSTVFFKGCSLSCKWCHNPESIDFKPIVQWQKDRCINCLTCIEACPTKAINFNESGLFINNDICKRCSTCVKECPTGALIMKGHEYTLDGLVKEVIKDKVYFGDNGGVTLSGGEVLMQGEFAIKLLKSLKERGISTAVDTAGLVPFKVLQEALEYTDVLLYDIKLIDPNEHKKFCGASNELILDNLIKISQGDVKWRLWIRTPIIPDATDSNENIAGIAEFINKNLKGRVEKWELCSFNNLCRNKYEMLHQKWDYQNTKLNTKEKMESLVSIAKEILDEKDIVRYTGATQ